MKNVHLDASGKSTPGMWKDKAGLIVKRIRQIGINRILYGCDAATPNNLPTDALEKMAKAAADGTRVSYDLCRTPRCDGVGADIYISHSAISPGPAPVLPEA
jgi:hypothetical protein